MLHGKESMIQSVSIPEQIVKTLVPALSVVPRFPTHCLLIVPVSNFSYWSEMALNGESMNIDFH